MHNLSCACSIKVELFSDLVLYSNIGGKLLEFIYTYLIRVCVEKKIMLKKTTMVQRLV